MSSYCLKIFTIIKSNTTILLEIILGIKLISISMNNYILPLKNYLINKLLIKLTFKVNNINVENIILENNHKMENKNEYNAEYIENVLTQNDSAILLKNIIYKFQNYFSNSNMQYFYENIANVKIEQDSHLKSGGEYIQETNTIKLKSYKDFEYILSHESLHMGTSNPNKDENFKMIVGFHQHSNDFFFTCGRAINEGYTELLNSRINNQYKKSYKDQLTIAKLIELFFENPQDMQDLYFQSDLNGLVKNLESYTSRKEINSLITNSDCSAYIELKTKRKNLISYLMNIKIMLQLYKWFASQCDDKEKMYQFQQILYKYKLLELMIKLKKTKLYKEISIPTKQKSKHF